MSCCVTFESRFASQLYILIVMITSLRNVLYVFVVDRSKALVAAGERHA